MGSLIGSAVILVLMALLSFPDMLFFLNPSQKEAVTTFQETYFSRYMPIRTESGGFDFLRIVAVIFMVACCAAVMRIIALVFDKIKLEDRHAETLKILLANVLRYVVIIFAIVFGLNMLGADILTVIASLGILALVIGFGAQSLIEDIFAGLFIIFEGRFYVGDIISVDGFRGTVRSIGIVSTQIADAGGNIKIINNSDIRTLVNLSEVRSVAVSIVSISYNADLIVAEKVIRDMAEKLPQMYPEVFPSAPVYAGVENLGESSVDLKLTAAVDEANIYAARRIMNRELKLALDAAHIEIPFPQVVVWQGK